MVTLFANVGAEVLLYLCWVTSVSTSLHGQSWKCFLCYNLSFSFLFLKYCPVYMGVWLACMSVNHWCAWGLWRPEDSTKWPIAAVTDGSEALCGLWELNLGSLEEQPVFLTTEQSFQPWQLIFKRHTQQWKLRCSTSIVSSSSNILSPPLSTVCAWETKDAWPAKWALELRLGLLLVRIYDSWWQI